jgi:outer membrane lipoprotein-sorting protein
LQEKEKIEEIKEKIIKKYESIESLSYRVRETFEFNHFRHELTAWVASKKPSMFYYEDNKTIRVSNGSVLREYRKGTKAWNIDFAYSTTPRIFGVDRVYRMLASNELNVKLEVGEIDGRKCYLFSIKRDGENISLWIDGETLLPAKVVSKTMNITVEFEYSDFKINDVDEKLFEKKPNATLVRIERFNLPESKSIELFKRQTGFPLLVPSYTAGFKFNRISTYRVGEIKCASLFYKKGDFSDSQNFHSRHSFVIIECLKGIDGGDGASKNVTFDNITAEFYSIKGGSLVKFRKEGVFLHILGDLSEEEIIKVAKSLD